MYVNIKIIIKGIGTVYPKGFYYKGSEKNLKVVIVGINGSSDLQTFPFKDCEICLTKINEFGDEFTI